MTTIKLSGRELNTVLAALRFYQKDGMADPDSIAIATDDGEEALTESEIDDLCERINVEDESDDDDIDDEDEETVYENHYVHHGRVWSDTWTAMCNDECPECGAEIEPFMSEELDDNGGIVDTIMHVSDDFVPENGWPEGITSLAELIAEVA